MKFCYIPGIGSNVRSMPSVNIIVKILISNNN